MRDMSGLYIVVSVEHTYIMIYLSENDCRLSIRMSTAGVVMYVISFGS